MEYALRLESEGTHIRYAIGTAELRGIGIEGVDRCGMRHEVETNRVDEDGDARRRRRRALDGAIVNISGHISDCEQGSISRISDLHGSEAAIGKSGQWTGDCDSFVTKHFQRMARHRTGPSSRVGR